MDISFVQLNSLKRVWHKMLSLPCVSNIAFTLHVPWHDSRQLFKLRETSNPGY